MGASDVPFSCKAGIQFASYDWRQGFSTSASVFESTQQRALFTICVSKIEADRTISA
jgi:hypothetical protein